LKEEKVVQSHMISLGSDLMYEVQAFSKWMSMLSAVNYFFFFESYSGSIENRVLIHVQCLCFFK